MEDNNVATLIFGIFFGCGWLLSLSHIYCYYCLVEKGLTYRGMMPIGVRIILSVIIGTMSLALILQGLDCW